MVAVIASYEDIKNREISRNILFTGVVSGVINTIFYRELVYALTGSVMMAAPLYILAYVFLLTTGRQCIGGGDIKIAFVYGLFLKYSNLIFAAYLITFSFAGVFLLIKKIRKSGDAYNAEIPLIPFLSIGTIIAMGII